MARSTSGEVIGHSSRVGWVRLPHGLLEGTTRSERGKAWLSRVVGGHEIAGSNPAVLTDRATRQSGRGADGSTPALGAGGSDSVFGSASDVFDSEVPDLNGSRGLVAHTRLITESR